MHLFSFSWELKTKVLEFECFDESLPSTCMTSVSSPTRFKVNAHRGCDDFFKFKKCHSFVQKYNFQCVLKSWFIIKSTTSLLECEVKTPEIDIPIGKTLVFFWRLKNSSPRLNPISNNVFSIHNSLHKRGSRTCAGRVHHWYYILMRSNEAETSPWVQWCSRTAFFRQESLQIFSHHSSFCWQFPLYDKVLM